MLEVKHLSYQYTKEKKILSDINFTLKKGEMMAVLGNNGIGKSTLLKCLTRILTPTTGEVIYKNQNLLELSQREIAKHFAYVSQRMSTFELTVDDFIMIGRKPYQSFRVTQRDHEIVEKTKEILGIPNSFNNRLIYQLSEGEKQKVMVARALAQEPKFLLLDEPTSNLDVKNQFQVLQKLKEISEEHDIGVLMVIHDINLAMRFCDRFLFLKDEHVFANGDKSIINEKILKDVYDMDSQILPIEGDSYIYFKNE